MLKQGISQMHLAVRAWTKYYKKMFGFDWIQTKKNWIAQGIHKSGPKFQRLEWKVFLLSEKPFLKMKFAGASPWHVFVLFQKFQIAKELQSKKQKKQTVESFFEVGAKNETCCPSRGCPTRNTEICLSDLKLWHLFLEHATVALSKTYEIFTD